MPDASLTPLYDKKESCPLCETTFTSKKVRSRFIKIDHTDSDFCPYYIDEENSPLLYFVKVCPSCGYSYSDHFKTYFQDGTKDAILQSVSVKWVPHNYGEERTVKQAIQTYKLAIYCATLKKEKNIALAGLLLRLTWLYRKLGNETGEKRFMELALEPLNNAYLEGYFGDTDMTEIRVLYLLGELKKRLGLYDQAMTHFARVVDKQNSTLERKIVDLAREQWRITKELIKKEQDDQNETTQDHGN